MLEYDEKKLVQQLGGLSHQKLVVFALRPAEFLLPCFSRYARRMGSTSDADLRRILDRAWGWVGQGTLSQREAGELLDLCMTLIPDEDQATEAGEPYAEDAGAAAAYVLRTITSGSPQEAAYAARRAYEAMDHFAERQMEQGLAPHPADQPSYAHPFVQRELTRQQALIERLARSNLTAQEMAEVLRLEFQAEAGDFLP